MWQTFQRLEIFPLILSGGDFRLLALGDLWIFIGQISTSLRVLNFWDFIGNRLDLLKLQNLLGSSDNFLHIESNNSLSHFSLIDHTMKLDIIEVFTTSKVSGMSLLSVLILTVSFKTVLVSFAGEEDGAILTLGDVSGSQQLPVFLALTKLRLQHSFLILIDHVFRELRDLVGVLTLSFNTFLHDSPVVLSQRSRTQRLALT